MTPRQTTALLEIAEFGGQASSAITLVPFPTIRSLVSLGLLEWTLEPERRVSISPQGWTGRETVTWLYAARLTDAGRQAVDELRAAA